MEGIEGERDRTHSNLIINKLSNFEYCFETSHPFAENTNKGGRARFIISIKIA